MGNVLVDTFEKADRYYLGGAAVRQRYGNASKQTLWRWQRDPDLGFPSPAMELNGYHYWNVSDLNDFDARQAAKFAAKPAGQKRGHDA